MTPIKKKREDKTIDIDDFRNGSRDFKCGCVDVYRDSNFGGVYGLW